MTSIKHRHSIIREWRSWLFLLVIFIFALPVITVGLNSFAVPEMVSQHLGQYVLPRVIPTTLILVFSVTLIATILGVLAAWCVVMVQFPGRRFFSWALLLPIAIPGYVMAFVLLGLLDYSGPIQSFLRELFGSNVWFPKVRSLGGAILALSLCLYPYVYLLVRGAFEQQGQRALEVAQSLGHSRLRAMFSLALPMARPWIFAGAILVMMESLADFGTVAVFNVDTLTTAIYQAWYGMDALSAALRLAAFLMLFMLIVLWLESRNRKVNYQVTDSLQQAKRMQVSFFTRLGVFLFCALLFGLAFVLPVIQLMTWFVEHIELFIQPRYIEFFRNSLFLAIIGSSLLVVLALAVIAMQRFLSQRYRYQQNSIQFLARALSLGYAIPGTVLAVGLFVPLAYISKQLANVGWHTQLLTGSVFALLLGYTIRFFAVAYRPVDSQMQRFSSSLEEMSESFQVTGLAKWQQVMLPLLKPGLLTAFALSFVDIMKEMPLTLMTRPFGWDTLAIQIYELTAEGEWERAAVPAMAIVFAGLLPVYFLNKQREP